MSQWLMAHFRPSYLSFSLGIVVFVGVVQSVDSHAQTSPTMITRAFYTQHFRTADRMFFSRENVRRERRWFTRRLYNLMQYELRRQEENKTDEHGNLMKPHISGDVFTDSESPPQVFRIGRTRQTRTWATVVVTCYWNDHTIGKMKRRVTVRLVPRHNSWLIDNVIDEDGKDLITDLSRPVYFSD